jgi:ribosomal protein S6--L-glutamate ligase
MKIAILGPGPNVIGYTTKRLLEEAKKVFKKTELIPLIDIKLKVNDGVKAYYGKKSLDEWDYILLKIDSKRAGIGYPIVRFLDSMGVNKQYPAETVLLAHNKFLTLEVLGKNKLPVPDTYMTGSRNSAKEIIGKQKLPMILKLLSGFGGQGVIFIESKEAANTVIETMKTLKQEILIEEFVPNPGEDIRGIVAGDEVIASYKRIAAKGEKKSNIYAGGRAESFKLTEEMNEIVLKCAKVMNIKIGAVDMIQNKKGELFVTEVNINPGIQGLEKVTNLNVAQRIVEYIKTQIKK